MGEPSRTKFEDLTVELTGQDRVFRVSCGSWAIVLALLTEVGQEVPPFRPGPTEVPPPLSREIADALLRILATWEELSALGSSVHSHIANHKNDAVWEIVAFLLHEADEGFEVRLVDPTAHIADSIMPSH